MKKTIKIFSLVLTLLCIGGISPANGEILNYLQVPGLLDIRTNFSDGIHTLEYIIELAKKRGFEVLFLNDHDLMTVEYGLWPLRNIFKKKENRSSILKNGAENYLNQIQTASIKFPETILIPGAESSPFYFWKGSLFKRNLTLCDYEKHLLLVGLEKERDYENLPIIHNKIISKFHVPAFSIGVFLLAIALYLSLFKKKRRRILRYSGILLIVFCFLLIVNNFTLKKSFYSPYQGYQGIAPYQSLIDYVNSRGGFVFWNHPETKSGQGKLGPVFRETAPYPQVLTASKGYTGFAAIYAEGITITEPGGLWDKILLEYCEGKRERPIWGISTADFHEEGHAGEKLGNFPTVFLVKEKSKKNILDALKKGRMYAYRGDVDLPRLRLEDFSVSDSESIQRGVMGEEIRIKGFPVINILLSTENPEEVNPLKVRLVRDGKLLKEFFGETPLKINFQDEVSKPRRKTYYRLDVRDSRDRVVVSNPIFIVL